MSVGDSTTNSTEYLSSKNSSIFIFTALGVMSLWLGGCMQHVRSVSVLVCYTDVPSQNRKRLCRRRKSLHLSTRLFKTFIPNWLRSRYLLSSTSPLLRQLRKINTKTQTEYHCDNSLIIAVSLEGKRTSRQAVIETIQFYRVKITIEINKTQ